MLENRCNKKKVLQLKNSCETSLKDLSKHETNLATSGHCRDCSRGLRHCPLPSLPPSFLTTPAPPTSLSVSVCLSLYVCVGVRACVGTSSLS